MNTSGFNRGIMARNYNPEKFLLHVADVIERQLNEWDANYEVLVLKFEDYKVIVKNMEQDYFLSLTENKIASLQSSGPYVLDRKIWKELEHQGLPIISGDGNYLEFVF